MDMCSACYIHTSNLLFALNANLDV